MGVIIIAGSQLLYTIGRTLGYRIPYESSRCNINGNLITKDQMKKIIEVAFKEREYKLSESTTIKLTEFKITGSDAMVFSSKFSDEDCFTVTAKIISDDPKFNNNEVKVIDIQTKILIGKRQHPFSDFISSGNSDPGFLDILRLDASVRGKPPYVDKTAGDFIEQCFIEKLFPEMGKKFTSNTDEIHVSEIQVAADQPHSDNTQVETITLI